VFILGIDADADTTLESASAKEEVIIFGNVLEGELDGGGVRVTMSDGGRSCSERIVEEEFAGERKVVGGGFRGDRDAIDTIRQSVEHISSLEQMYDKE
jgi:hypothetical protein